MTRLRASSMIFLILVSSTLAGCTASDVKDDLEEAAEKITFAVGKTLCFGSTVLNAGIDGTISGQMAGTIDLVESFGQYLEIETPVSAAIINSSQEASGEAFKSMSLEMLEKAGPYGRGASLAIKVIDFVGEMACAKLGDQVNDEVWYNYTYNLAEFAAENNQIPQNLAFQAAAQLIDSQTGARSEGSVEFTLTLMANATENCLETCGNDGQTILFEEGVGLTSPFSTTRDIDLALDEDLDSYAFSAAFLCPSLNSPIEFCITNGSSVIRIPHISDSNQRIAIHYDAALICPGEEEQCSVDSVRIDAFLCSNSGGCSDSKPIYDCNGCELQMEWNQPATEVIFVLRLSNSHIDNAVSLKVYNIAIGSQ